MTLDQSLLEQNVQRILKPQVDEIDRRLPEWARRSNPIVRRQLGVFWKLMIIDFDLIGRWYLFNAALVGLSLLIPFLFMLLMPAAVVSLVALPALLVLYALSLGRIATAAAASMADERAKGSLDLLRVCPRPLREILFSKAAASVWRQVENLGLVLTGVAALSLPVLVIQYDWLFPSMEQPLAMRAAMLLALAAALVRIPLETALIASIGVAAGCFTRHRIAAMLAAVLLGAAYFGFINLARLLAVEPVVRLMLDTLLPVFAPLPLILLAYWVAQRRIERE
jgi:hypothetical protein